MAEAEANKTYVKLVHTDTGLKQLNDGYKWANVQNVDGGQLNLIIATQFRTHIGYY